MKSKKQILKRWREQGNKWDKLSQRHANSKETTLKGYVTDDEHITGERLSFVEGWIHALEWVMDNDKDKKGEEK